MSTNAALGGAATGAGTGAAIGGPYGALIGGAVGGIAGLMQSDTSGAAQDAINAAIAQYTNLGLPPDQSAQIVYQQLQAGGQLTPELESALQNVAASSVQDNAQTRSQLTGALQDIRGRAFGGLTPEQMANQQQLLQQVNASTQAQEKGLLQNQEQRGQGNSGATLAAQLAAVQGGAQQSSNNALQIGAQGANAQNAALAQYLSGVSSLRAADTSRDTTNAQLSQQANMFNTQNSAARNARNTAAVNAANQSNLNRQNNVNDANTEMANQEKLRELQAQHQYWQDQMTLANAKGNAYLGQGNILTQQAQNSNQNFNNTLQGIGTVGTAIGQNNRSQDQLDAYNARTNAMNGSTNQTNALNNYTLPSNSSSTLASNENQTDPWGNAIE